MNKIILMDGRNQLFRQHFAHKSLSTEEGFPTGALHGCLSSMISIARRLPDASFVWVWDGGGDTWRHRFMNTMPLIDGRNLKIDGESEVTEPYRDFVTGAVQESFQFLGIDKPKRSPREKPKGYKGNRVYAEKEKTKSNEFPVDERQRALLQLPVLKLILEGAGFRNFEVRGLEGDDLLAMLATQILGFLDKAEVIIHSGDRDFYQLLSHQRVKILKRMEEGKLVWTIPEEIEMKYGVSPKDWVKYRAWTGDSGDNIGHLYKVGPKTALKLLAAGMDPSITDFRTIDREIRERFEKLFQPHGIARLWNCVVGNYRLCRLVTKSDDMCLSEAVRKQLTDLASHTSELKCFQRDQSEKTSDAYRKISFLLMRYELASVLGERQRLWQIP